MRTLALSALLCLSPLNGALADTSSCNDTQDGNDITKVDMMRERVIGAMYASEELGGYDSRRLPPTQPAPSNGGDAYNCQKPSISDDNAGAKPGEIAAPPTDKAAAAGAGSGD